MWRVWVRNGAEGGERSGNSTPLESVLGRRRSHGAFGRVVERGVEFRVEGNHGSGGVSFGFDVPGLRQVAETKWFEDQNKELI